MNKIICALCLTAVMIAALAASRCEAQPQPSREEMAAKWAEVQETMKRVKELSDAGNTDALIAGLKDENPMFRRMCAQELGRLNVDKAVAPLMELAGGEDAEMRGIAVSALSKMGDDAVLNLLVNALKDPEETVRALACSSLSGRKDKRAVGALVAALQDNSPGVRHSAAFALQMLDDKKAIEPLMAQLNVEEAPNVRKTLVSALGAFKDARTVPVLVGALKDGLKETRLSAVRALERIEDARAVEPLVPLLKDTDRTVRSAAARALRTINDPRSKDALAGALDNDATKYDAAVALGEMGDPRALDALIGLVPSTRDKERVAVIMALSKIKDAKAVDALLAMTRDRDIVTCSTAATALGETGDPRVVAWLIEIVDNRESNTHVRGSAFRALAELKDPASIHCLGRVALENSSPTPEIAMRTLLEMKDPKATQKVVEALRNDNHGTKLAAAKAFAAAKDPAGVEALIECLEYKNPGPRIESMRALAAIGDKRAVEPIIARLSETMWSPRLAAVQALGQLGDERAIAPLRKLAEKERREDIRHSIRESLKQLGVAPDALPSPKPPPPSNVTNPKDPYGMVAKKNSEISDAAYKLEKERNYEEAIAKYREYIAAMRAIESDKDIAFSLCRIAMCYQKLGKNAEALEACNEVRKNHASDQDMVRAANSMTDMIKRTMK